VKKISKDKQGFIERVIDRFGWDPRPGVTNLFAIAGHFVSYRWVSGPHNFLVIQYYETCQNRKGKKRVKESSRLLVSPECFVGRTKFFCGPHEKLYILTRNFTYLQVLSLLECFKIIYGTLKK